MSDLLNNVNSFPQNEGIFCIWTGTSPYDQSIVSEHSV